jgi:hypothetical protein
MGADDWERFGAIPWLHRALQPLMNRSHTCNQAGAVLGTLERALQLLFTMHSYSCSALLLICTNADNGLCRN